MGPYMCLPPMLGPDTICVRVKNKICMYIFIYVYVSIYMYVCCICIHIPAWWRVMGETNREKVRVLGTDS